MKKSDSKDSNGLKGSCFIVGTPIGEEDDLTQRGVRTLQTADMLVVPDEKVAARLLKRFAVSKSLIGISDENLEEVAGRVMEGLRNGDRVIIMSDSTLLLAEPIRHLANMIREAGLEPRIIPGVDLTSMALMMSGFPADRYIVAGFIPTRKEPREDFIRTLSERYGTVILFASAARLTSTLAAMEERMAGRTAAVVLKPTVPGELVMRGTIKALRGRLGAKMLSGIVAIVLGPIEEEEESAGSEAREWEERGDRNRRSDDHGGDRNRDRRGDDRGGENRRRDDRGGENRRRDDRGGENRRRDDRGGENRRRDDRGGENRRRDDRGGTGSRDHRGEDRRGYRSKDSRGENRGDKNRTGYKGKSHGDKDRKGDDREGYRGVRRRQG